MKTAHALLLATLAISLFACAGSEPKPAAASNAKYDTATKFEMDEGHRKVNDNIGSGPIGSRTNPVKCEGIEGAKAYLAQLKGPGGEAVSFAEPVEAGVGPFESLIYYFEVSFTGKQGEVKKQVFFDPDFTGYHEPKPAAGFSK